METLEKTQAPKSSVNEKDMKGRWKLTYEVRNTIGAAAFGNAFLGSYNHPITGKKVFLMDINGKPKLGFSIDKPKIILKGDRNESIEDFNALVFLLDHPSVEIEGLKMNPKVQSKKKKNSNIKLISLDLRDQKIEDEQEVIDILIGKLSETGQFSIGTKKIKYILAAIKQPFRDSRYMNDPASESKALKTKLKNFVRKGYDNAVLVNDTMKNIEYAKKVYVIKALLTSGNIYESNGSIKYNDSVLGHSIDAVISKVEQQPTLWLELQKELSDQNVD